MRAMTTRMTMCVHRWSIELISQDEEAQLARALAMSMEDAKQNEDAKK